MKKCCVGIIVLMVALAGSLQAQSVITEGGTWRPQLALDSLAYQDMLSFDMVGGGARAEGMGYAYVGISDDITAGAWNPAGLVVHQSPMLGVSYGSLSSAGHTNRTNPGGEIYRHDHGISSSNVSGLNFVAPFRMKGHPFVGSFNYSRSFEDIFEIGWDDEIRIPVAVFNNMGMVDFQMIDAITSDLIRLDASLSTVAFSLGTRVYDNYSFGVGVNIYTGGGKREFFHSNLLQDYPMPPGSQQTLVIEDLYEVDTLKYSGVNFTLGVKWSGEKLSGGLTLRTPFDLKVNEGQSIYLVTSVNGFPIEQGTDTTFFDNILTKYGMPLIISGGLGYQVNEKLLVAMAAEFKAFGSSEVRFRESFRLDQSGQTQETFSSLDPQWENVFSIRVGCEYMNETSFGKIPLRAGFALVPTPIPNLDGTPTQTSLSLGTGIQWSLIHLDWAYTYATLSRDLERAEIDAEIKNHHVGFTFTGYF